MTVIICNKNTIEMTKEQIKNQGIKTLTETDANFKELPEHVREIVLGAYCIGFCQGGLESAKVVSSSISS